MPSARRADLVMRADRAVVGEGASRSERAATIVVARGRVTAVQEPDVPVEATDEVRFGPDVVLLPGFVDTHVHLQDPGRDGWEGFDSGTAAAAAGGVTTLVDMPLDSLPVTTSVEALTMKRDAARGRTSVDVLFWAGAVPGNLGSLGGLLDAGCVGVKAYLSDSGLAEFPPLSPADLRRALTELAQWSASSGRPATLAVHAEDPAALAAGARDTELPAVLTVIDAVRRTAATAQSPAGRAHVVHVSSADAADAIAAARAEGLAVTAETCPHYLTLNSEDPPSNADCGPPIRDRANQERLWAHLVAGTFDCVVSDHSPSPGDVPGIASLELAPSVLWTAMRERGLPLTDLAGWAAQGSADLVGLAYKGRIAVGADADFCVFAPDEPFAVEPLRLFQRQRVTPYDGRALYGVVKETWRAGDRG
jgi:allantoinase